MALAARTTPRNRGRGGGGGGGGWGGGGGGEGGGLTKTTHHARRSDAEQAKRFYGDLFGWRYALDPNSEGKYHLVSYPGADTPSGGIFDTGGAFPNHAIFMVVVQDVAAVCAQV